MAVNIAQDYNSPMLLFAAFLAGFFGSLHCIGMCGGIVGVMGLSARNSQRKTFWQQLPYWLGYNFGRLTSYVIAGLIAGSIGAQAAGIFEPARVQNIGILLAGSFLILLGLYISGWWQGLGVLEKGGALIWQRIQPLAQKALKAPTPLRAVTTGLIWGWLPCGLVYAMLVWAMTVATPLGGASIMLAFGLGTLPMLLGLGAASQYLDKIRHDKRWRQLAGGLILLFGVLIFTGLVSPFHVPVFSNPDICATPQLR